MARNGRLPFMAGLVAVYDQALGGSLGFLNPLIYALNGSSAYHDINDGTAWPLVENAPHQGPIRLFDRFEIVDRLARWKWRPRIRRSAFA